MKLTDLTRRYIESFSGSVIFGRGEGYYRTGRVTDLEYDEDAATIIADVSGNYGNYYVEIVEEDGGIEADCDWPDFEERFIARIKKKDLGFGYNYDHLLAEIYDYQGDTDKLWEAVQGNAELLSKYEKKLAPIYPEEYLKEYERIVDRYIERRGRDNYRSAAQYAERIKKLYRTVLKEPERWETYIQNLRAVNKKLRAMQEEFSHL